MRRRAGPRHSMRSGRLLRNRGLWYGAFAAAVLTGSLGLFGYNVLSTIGPGAADPTDPRQVERGRAVYADACALCHGKNLEGQPNWRVPRPSGDYPAPPHDRDGHTWHHPDRVLFRITKHGGQAEAPPGFKSGMPGFGNALSDADILAVLAYIKSRWPEDIRTRQAEVSRRSRGQ